jgi:ATP-dependent helicase/nuclease subunit B
MQSFLSRVVSDVLANSKGSLQHTIFVLPSQRAGVFAKREMVNQLDTATFLPEFISIENYIQEIAGIKQIDQVQLLFEFYSVYKSITPIKDIESFDSFSQWAIIVLQDFNEVDRHLVNSKDLFLYLRDINRLNNWEPNTKLTKNYFAFFERLHEYYDKLYADLISINVGYQGLIYREAEANISHYINNNSEKQIVLVGFNALNKAEEHMFQELLESGLASIYWDADSRYLESSNETGIFLRKYKQGWKYFENNTFKWSDDYSKENKQEIHIIGASKNVSQLKYVGELLDKKTSFSDTAVVLADESLLSLSMNSLPESVDKINVTMGLSLKDIPLANFFNSIFQLYLNQEKLQLTEKSLFYYKDVLGVFSHPTFSVIANSAVDYASIIGKNNYIFLGYQEILEHSKNENKELINLFFGRELMNVSYLIAIFKEVILFLKEQLDAFGKEQVFRFYTIIQQIDTLNIKFGHIRDLKSFHQFFNQLVGVEKMAFQGEPLEGLQLMGMLETRAIDFETVIITSMNEGILPASKSDSSFIPFDVKQQFGLPSFKEKDAIFSYHFYRLLHRAKEVYLIYNTEKDVYGSGEKSRFLTQLALTRQDIQHRIITSKLSNERVELMVVEKSDLLYQDLVLLASKGISPSALGSYLNNPIDFYYQKILKIREVDEVEETVAVNTMGTAIHETLEQLYLPYIGTQLNEDVVNKMKLRSNNLIELNFKKSYKNGDLTHGKNKLVFEVSKNYLKRFLNLELEELKKGKRIEILSLEERLSIEVQVEGLDFPIKLGGIVDRIDRVDGVLRILDYKTGMVKATDLKMPDFSLMKEGYKYSKSLQVMLYAYLYCSRNNIDESQNLEAGIISFKNLNSGFLKMNFSVGRTIDSNISKERLENFMEELKLMLKEIFNADIPFKENPNKVF